MKVNNQEWYCPHCGSGVTIIEGTRYANALLITLGQNGLGSGPFVICSRENGEVTMRTITQWPEPHDIGVRPPRPWPR